MINVHSEIMPLKRVLLHRPGNELLNLTPESLGRLLYDDIPYLKVAQEEHDEFASILRNNGVEVVYLEDLVSEVLDLDPKIKEEFISQFVSEAGVRNSKYKRALIDYLQSFKNSKDLIIKTMEGIKVSELSAVRMDTIHSLVDLVTENSTFVSDPMPNLIFTRDPFASIGNGISLNKMYSVTRNRETIYADYIFKYHPEYKDTLKYYDRYNTNHIEGGDILVLAPNIVAVGISQRTQPEAIEELALNLFKDSGDTFDTVLAINIPDSRAFMHLDTVFTQIDYDKFTYHPGIMETLQVFEIKPDKKNGMVVKEIRDSLKNILETYLNRDITLIPCGGGDKVVSEREQWNDGSNTLCISPGVVVVYDRNNVTNEILKSYGITVLEMRGSELSRGRGGPRCMSMPLIREDK